MPLIEALLLLLVLSRVLGEIVARFGQPAMIGEIVAGVLLGPSALNYVHFNPEIRAIAQLGVLLLAFMSGMEMDMDALWASFRGRGAWVSTMGFVMPLGLGILIGKIFGLDATRTLFIGLCVAITALPVSIRILMDLGKLRTEIGQKIISAAVANDVVSLLALGIILDVKGGAQTNFFISMVWALCKALLFMSVIVIAARLAKRYTVGRFRRSRSALDRILVKVKGKESVFALVLVFVIAFASFSEVLGLDFVVGAFFGSMLLSHQILGRANFEEIQKDSLERHHGISGPDLLRRHRTAVRCIRPAQLEAGDCDSCGLVCGENFWWLHRRQTRRYAQRRKLGGRHRPEWPRGHGTRNRQCRALEWLHQSGSFHDPRSYGGGDHIRHSVPAQAGLSAHERAGFYARCGGFLIGIRDHGFLRRTGDGPSSARRTSQSSIPTRIS